jgi:FtsX-like permease family protein
VVVRRILFVVRLALVRLRARWARLLLVGIGIAVGAALLAAAVGGSVAVQDRSAQRALAALDPSDRSVQAVWSGVPLQSEVPLRVLDSDARAAVRSVTGREPFRVMLFREYRLGGALVNLGAVDGLRTWVKLRSGRLPQPCARTLCETLQVGGSGPLPHLPFLRVVGRATLAKGAPLSAYFGTRGNAPVPILLADGVRGLSRLPIDDADLIARTYAWIDPIAPGAVHEWQLGAFAARIADAGVRLAGVSDVFTVTGPLDTVSAVRETGRVAGRRLLLIGGEAAVLLLGFAVFAATRLRRDTEAVQRRLTWFGAGRAQLLLLAAVETAAVAVVATAVGWAAGAGLGALLADHLGAPPGAVLAHSVVSGRGLALALALAATAALVVLASLRARVAGFGGWTVTIADVAAIGALGAVGLALARGGADAESLARGDGTGVVLLLLPGLVVFVAAVAFARIVAPVLRLAERAGRRGPVPVRLAALSIARHPGSALVFCVFLLISVSLAVFAAGYRATLSQNVDEQARYAVPADFVLSEDLERLVTVQEAAPLAAYRRVGEAMSVFRGSGTVAGRPSVDYTLLGVPASSVSRIDGWRDDFASQSRAKLAAALAPSSPVTMRGLRVPGGAKELSVPIKLRGDRVNLAFVLRNARGDFTVLGVGDQDAGKRVLRVRVPPVARGGRLVAVRFAFPALAAFVAGHKESGTKAPVNDAFHGFLDVGPMTAGGRRLGGYRGWTGTGGVSIQGTGSVEYLVNRAAESFFRPQQPTDDTPVPVLAAPAVAAAAGPAGEVALNVGGIQVEAKVVGVVRHFPSVTGNAVVADRAALATALDTQLPGTGVANEVWLDAPPSAAAALADPPFDRLDVASQRALDDSLRSDPLGRGSLAILSGTAVVALALAVLGLLLTVAADRRDERGELFDLQTQGAAERDLRRHLRLRVALLGVLGSIGGIATGVALSALVVDVVTVTAQGTNPDPPLRLALDWPLLVLGLAVVVVAAAALVGAATHRVRGAAA